MGKIPAKVIGLFAHNIGLKLVSIVCAICLWLFVSVNKNKISDFPGSLPVEIRNIPVGLAAIYDPQKIKVRLNTPPDSWMNLGVENFNVYADLFGLSEGTHEVDIKAAVNVPNVNVVEKTPSTMFVRLEPVVKKDIPVKVVIRGQPKSGFVASEPEVNPANVEVKGPKSLIDEVSELEALIELKGEGRDFQKRVSAYISDEKDKISTGIEFTPKRVNVFVPIVPSSGIKTVGIKVVTKGQPKANYYISKIECTPAIVDISSSIGFLQSCTYIETKGIEIEGLEKNLEKEVELSIPKGITCKTRKVRVKIFPSLNTTNRIIPASFDYAIIPKLRVTSVDPVKVNVSGPANIINKLTPDKVVISLDLQTLNAGTHSGVKIEKGLISLPPGCTAVSWLPSAVSIVLEKYP